MISIQHGTYGAIITVDCPSRLPAEASLSSHGIWLYANYYADDVDYVGKKRRFS